MIIAVSNGGLSPREGDDMLDYWGTDRSWEKDSNGDLRKCRGVTPRDRTAGGQPDQKRREALTGEEGEISDYVERPDAIEGVYPS